jgi:hypothetical protein
MVLGSAGAICFASALAAIAVQSCSSRVIAQSPSACVTFGSTPGALTQTWVVGNPPSGMTPGSYVVTLSDGEAEIAGVSLGGADTLLTIPLSATQLPAGGIGVNTVQIDGQWQQLDCPAIGK